MTTGGQRWAIVLGAGDGTRLQSLTRHGGVAVPKQYCTLGGRRSLLQMALDRAERVVGPSSVVTVVAEGHRAWWSRDLQRLPPRNAVVQPGNRGTAAGVLLPLLEVRRRDPRGRVVLLPSDHWVERERVLAEVVDAALDRLERDPRRILMLGISPEQPETGYGWIVPGGACAATGGLSVRAVEAFVEKPDLEAAVRLMDRGGLWNSFLIAATVPALIDLYVRRLPHLLALLGAAVQDESGAALAVLYAGLGDWDFSRDLLQGSESDLGVVHVPPCGWTDLGTPVRVLDCLRRSKRRPLDRAARRTDRVNLALALPPV